MGSKYASSYFNFTTVDEQYGGEYNLAPRFSVSPITTDDVQSYSIYFADLELERDIGIGTKLP